MEIGYMGTSLEADLRNGFRYVNRVSKQLQSLPKEVTKEELLNYYLHEMGASGAVDTNITTVNLVQAANLAGIKVKGKSKLEVNVPIIDQWRYMTEETKAIIDRKSIRERLLKNKADIIAAYESGYNVKELASVWNISHATMHRYLHEFGVEIRKYSSSVMSLYGCNKNYKQKKRRKKRAE